MPPLQDQPSIHFSRTEDDEAVGTVRQFSDRLNLPASQVVPCLQDTEDSPIILRAGSGPHSLLILDSGGMEALRQCATSSSSA
ncbi:MAG: hypothetical protein ABEL51_03840 [Salinibacter sp.]